MADVPLAGRPGPVAEEVPKVTLDAIPEGVDPNWDPVQYPQAYLLGRCIISGSECLACETAASCPPQLVMHVQGAKHAKRMKLLFGTPEQLGRRAALRERENLRRAGQERAREAAAEVAAAAAAAGAADGGAQRIYSRTGEKNLTQQVQEAAVAPLGMASVAGILVDDEWREMQCPHCGAPLEVEKSSVEESVECPSCIMLVQVPAWVPDVSLPPAGKQNKKERKARLRKAQREMLVRQKWAAQAGLGGLGGAPLMPHLSGRGGYLFGDMQPPLPLPGSGFGMGPPVAADAAAYPPDPPPGTGPPPAPAFDPASFDLEQWLDSLGVGKYAAALKENDIGYSELTGAADPISHGDLKDIGITSLGHRKIILNGAAALAAGLPPRKRAKLDAEPSLIPTSVSEV